ncbi:UPF0236 family transposase-like protein [Bacillus sp. N9]
MDALRDYREILRTEKGVNTEGMRPMGAAESNMNLFSRRIKKWVIACRLKVLAVCYTLLFTILRGL